MDEIQTAVLFEMLDPKSAQERSHLGRDAFEKEYGDLAVTPNSTRKKQFRSWDLAARASTFKPWEAA